MAKPKVYTDDEKLMALAFYAAMSPRSGAEPEDRAALIAAAAKKAKVDEKSLAFWLAGGNESTAIAETAALVRQVSSTAATPGYVSPRASSRDLPSADLSQFDYEGDADTYTLQQRREYEIRRVSQIADGGMPLPPVHLTSPMRAPILIFPDLEMSDWVHRTFIGTEEDPEPDYWIEEHTHLRGVSIGFTWMNTEATKKGNHVVGTAELVGRLGDPWQTAEYHYHLMRAFGELPTFLIRLDAVFCSQASPIQIARLIDHELCHCSVKMKDGNPVMDRYGNFTFIIRGHDVEDFIGPMRRWGLKATHPATRAFVAAANSRPEFDEQEFGEVCEGVCCGCGSSF